LVGEFYCFCSSLPLLLLLYTIFVAESLKIQSYSAGSGLVLSAQIVNIYFSILEKRLREAYEKLKKRGIPLATNQVNYSLIYRAPEENGVKSTCDELGITIIAYSPIAQGELLFIVVYVYYNFFISFFFLILH